MGKRGPKPRDPSSIEWSEKMAYAVGLIATDGSLSKSGRHIILVSKDKDQLETFKNILGLQRIKIGTGYSGRGDQKEYYKVQFGDVSFYHWLQGIGLTPNKSKTIGALAVPDQFFFDFLRGCFDGDGSIYAYWDPRWHSSYVFYLSFVSASRPFLEWLQQTSRRLVGVRGRIGQGSRVLQLRYAKRESLALFERMYYATGLPCLERKFVKAQKIFSINETHNKNAQVAELVYAYA
ncbi:MAG: hypothetical protein Q8R39_04530 [bacterium]|nr:hypothetical protein [bacterium]